MWPVKGKVLAPLHRIHQGHGHRRAGRARRCSPPPRGRVVYAGAGLRGYGKLVIIKHNNTWLSAYAHNDNDLVKEQQDVRKGQKIAEMGSTDADQVKLHFEVRRHGQAGRSGEDPPCPVTVTTGQHGARKSFRNCDRGCRQPPQ